MKMHRYPNMKCAETSHDCYGIVAECEIGLLGLRQDQLDEISESGSSATLELDVEQVALNKGILDLDDEDRKMLQTQGYIIRDVHANHTVCTGCGSESSFDKDGNVIYG